MNPARRGPTALASSLLAILGLMAVLAAGAQANWLVEGKELTTNETVAVSAHTPWTLTIPAKNIQFRCTTAASEELKLLAKSATAEGKVKYTGCTAFSPPGAEGKEQKNCKPKEPIVTGAITLITLHNGKSYLLEEPNTLGGKFSTIEVSELCALTESNDLTGKQVLECGQLVSSVFVQVDCSTLNISTLETVTSETLFPLDTLKFGANSATISGIIKLSLSGANAGKTWAGEV